jgi:hypothetical protein
MKVIYLFKFNNSEQILSVDVPDNATIDEINAIIFQNNNEWIAREYKSEWEILQEKLMEIGKRYHLG